MTQAGPVQAGGSVQWWCSGGPRAVAGAIARSGAARRQQAGAAGGVAGTESDPGMLQAA